VTHKTEINSRNQNDQPVDKQYLSNNLNTKQECYVNKKKPEIIRGTGKSDKSACTDFALMILSLAPFVYFAIFNHFFRFFASS